MPIPFEALWPLFAGIILMKVVLLLNRFWNCIFGKHDMEFDKTENQWHCTRCHKTQH